MAGPSVLDREFLEIRSLLLQLGAALDRLERDRTPADDPRMERLRRGVELLGSAGPSRATEIQMLFSRQYDPAWRQSMKI